MTIQITGSSGKTARHLAALLKPSHQILIASRSGAEVDGIPAVKFGWSDPVTISEPGNTNPLDIMKPFIDTGKEHGVKRFVLLSAIREDETTPGTGKVHAYLKQLDVEWAVLRPTWFMENFSEQQHLPTIRDESSIFSAAGHGKISFVSTEDIAAVACGALTDEKPHNRDYVIVGPELLSHYDSPKSSS
ncbi:MAG: hypothetical protein LQ340_000707 [Diploschistes diacapsis]|nr:MAG: hypothetical protein LQ340_000707 [Diploschistes diacapsis]